MLGQPVTPAANQQIQLADWGYAIALEQKGQRVDTPTPGYHDFVTALDVFLTADHGGLPAQSEIQIGYAEADAQASEAPPLPKAPSTATTSTTKSKQPPEPKQNGLPPVLSKPLNVTPKQSGDGYVFPVYGESSYTDTYRRRARRRLGRLAPRRRHLRLARRTDPRRRARHRLLRRLEQDRRLDGSGCETTEATSTTTRICPRTRRSQ